MLVALRILSGELFQTNRLTDLPCQHDNGYMDDRSQINVHTDERTQVHSAQSSLVVTHPSYNRARRYLTSVTESPSKHWSPPLTSKLFQTATAECLKPRHHGFRHSAIAVWKRLPITVSATLTVKSRFDCDRRVWTGSYSDRR